MKFPKDTKYPDLDEILQTAVRRAVGSLSDDGDVALLPFLRTLGGYRNEDELIEDRGVSLYGLFYAEGDPVASIHEVRKELRKGKIGWYN